MVPEIKLRLLPHNLQELLRMKEEKIYEIAATDLNLDNLAKSSYEIHGLKNQLKMLEYIISLVEVVPSF